ncbi:MAG: DUF3108 domain-containing protein, partial [Pseudomonadota bacterium]
QPSSIAARYEIGIAGINVGRFTFEANTTKRGYRLSGRGEVKALFGAFKWSGRLKSHGRLTRGGLTPTGYEHQFNSKRKILFKTKRKKRDVKMGFERGRVVALDVSPPAKTKGRVPLLEKHLRGVLDPMSAILMLSRLDGENPCRRKVEVFDGKTRFRLVLSYKGRQRVRGRGAEFDYTCGLRYVPVAGHKRKDEETEHVANNGDISIVLRTFPASKLVVAREVNISTVAGTAFARVTRVDMVTTDRRKVALMR